MKNKLLPILVVIMLFVAGGTIFLAFSAYKNSKSIETVSNVKVDVEIQPKEVNQKGWVNIETFVGNESEKTREFLIPKEVSKVKISYKLSASLSTDMFFIDVIDFRSKKVTIEGNEFNGLGTFMKTSNFEKEVILSDLVSGDYYYLDVKAFVDSWEINVDAFYE